MAYNTTTGFYQIYAQQQYNDYSEEEAKLDAVLKSPAVLFIFSLNCDLFSLGKPIVKIEDEIQEEHPIYNILADPNPFETQRQLLWNYMFYNMIGNAYLYIDKGVNPEDSVLYFLKNHRIKFPQKLINQQDALIISRKEVNDINKLEITYRLSNQKTQTIPLKKILHWSDLSTSAGGWYKAPSKLDALYKVISNSELALDAKNTGLLFSGKYMVSGKVSEKDLDNPMLSPMDKQDAERGAMSNKPVTAVSKMIDIKRFVEDLRKLELDKAFKEDCHTIGKMYGIPRDVIEAGLDGSTYENQEKSRGNHVDYVMMPKGNDFIDALMRFYEFEGEAELSWEHLPFNYFRTVEKEESQQRKANALETLLRSGVDPEDAQRILGYQFDKPINNEQNRNDTRQDQQVNR